MSLANILNVIFAKIKIEKVLFKSTSSNSKRFKECWIQINVKKTFSKCEIGK